MIPRCIGAIALRVVYHVGQKLSDLHGQPTRTLVMMVSAFIAVGGPWLSKMGRELADLPRTLQEKVKRMSRFLCRSEFDLGEAFGSLSRRIIETVAHAHTTRKILVSMDWTDLGEFMGLWLSLPYHGRALPLGCCVLSKPISEGDMTDEELSMVKCFLNLFSPEIRARLVILADRGFAKRDLFEVIQSLGAHWAIRLPRHRQIHVQEKWIELQDIPVAPGATTLVGQVEVNKEKPMAVYLAIRRVLPQQHDPHDDDDTWYVASDMAEGSTLLEWYSKRFQIEEMFRDLKDHWNIDRHRLKTEESVGKMMLVATLAYLVILEDGTQWRSRVDLDQIQKKTSRGKLSVTSIAQACFRLRLPDPPAEVVHLIVGRWMNARAA